MKLYKAGDVCDMAQVQPYVLRSWEKEFPGIGVQRSPEGPRLYRQSDIDQVLRIKQLVFGEGLTLAGARRRVDAELAATVEAGETGEVGAAGVSADARQRIEAVRAGLRQLLETLSREPKQQEGGSRLSGGEEYALQPSSAPPTRSAEKSSRTRSPRAGRNTAHASA